MIQNAISLTDKENLFPRKELERLRAVHEKMISLGLPKGFDEPSIGGFFEWAVDNYLEEYLADYECNVEQVMEVIWNTRI